MKAVESKECNCGKTRLIFISLFLQLIKNICGHSCVIYYPEWLDKIISAIILLTCAYICLKKTYQIKFLLIYIIVSIITLYGGFITGKMIIATTVLTIFSLRKENMKEIANFLYKWKVRLLFIHTVIAFMLTPLGIGYLNGYFAAGERFRWSMGFGMPGQFADYCFDIIVLWVFCNFHRINNKRCLWLVAISIGVMLLSDSRLIFIDSVVLIFLIWIIRKTDKFNNIIKLAAQVIIPLLTGGIFYTMYQFSLGNIYAVFIDMLVNTRIRLNGYLYDLYGPTLFGQSITAYTGQFSEVWQSTGSTFDCVYPWLVIEMGAVWLIILIVTWFMLAKRDNPMINCLLIVWALAATIDTDFVSGGSSFIILLIVMLFSDENYVTWF